SSREHAAIAPKYLGLKAVITKSFARIHLANLVNFGIAPLTFVKKEDYNKIDQGDLLDIELKTLDSKKIIMKNLTKNLEIPLTHSLSEMEIVVLKAGGKLPFIKKKYAS
ncbi:MAG: aconitate hydratase, partial [Candidatus Lokiarchaeota archaeon]|nr:aconitate hydratase [Candidatus Lokiarchaeota archaeon]